MPRKRRRILVIILVLVALGIIWAWFLYFQPATGTIHKSDLSQPSPTATSWSDHSILGMTVSLPDTYQLRDQHPGPERQTAQFLTRGVDASTRRFVLVTEQLPGMFDEYPAIKSRRLDPDKYQESAVVIDGQPALEFSVQEDGLFERAIFLRKDGHIISLAHSATTGFGTAKAAAEYDKIISSIQFAD